MGMLSDRALWDRALSRFQTALSFQLKSNQCSKKVADKQKSIAKQFDIKSDQITDGTSKMEGQSSGSMSRKRYTELIRMASGKSNQMSCNSTAGQAEHAELIEASNHEIERNFFRNLSELRTKSSFQSASQLYRNV